MNKKLVLSFCAASAITFSGCTTVADMAGADTATLNATAAQSYSQMVQDARNKGQLDTSSSTYKRINTVFQRLTPVANQMNQTGQPFSWQLAVLKSDQINAFVAPGGKVVFYTGIVNKLNLTDAEIAAIMGHEMVHALEEHAKSKIGAQALTNLALNIGLSAAGSNVGQLGTAAAQLGAQVGVGLPYSRNLESRADEGGLMLMARGGYNPQAAITLWEKMNRLEGGGGVSFLSTHPSNSQRIAAMRENLPAAQAIYNQNRR
ncbi:M48 family metallopeptidase [Acinetobacter sp. AND/436]|uniref:M48 family metallopeptidase n=1 Tax=Acinetobacter sp. AND/436 TaxID=3414736 RepID=UPI003C2B2429